MDKVNPKHRLFVSRKFNYCVPLDVVEDMKRIVNNRDDLKSIHGNSKLIYILLREKIKYELDKFKKENISESQVARDSQVSPLCRITPNNLYALA